MSKSSKRPSRFLFVGNSFTARNDLPDLIAQLASARGMNIEHALLSIGGASLRTHWNKGEAATAIERGKFDYVVPALHDKDQSHPTLAGSYLAACVFLKTLFGQSPAGIASSLPGLAAADVD